MEARKLIAPLMHRKSIADLDELDYLDDFIKRRINVKGQCAKSCPLYASCRYRAFYNGNRSDRHDFQICNHNYLIADVKHRAKGIAPLIPDYQAVIIDEAHKFLQAARQMYGFEISSLSLPEILREIQGFSLTQGYSPAGLESLAARLKNQLKRLFKGLIRNIPENPLSDEAERFTTVIDGDANRHFRNIRILLAELIEMVKNWRVNQKYRGKYNSAILELQILQERMEAFKQHANLIYWLEKPDKAAELGGGAETLLCAIPKNLNETLYTNLWNKGLPVVLTSGTLSASGDFSHIKINTGLDRLPASMIMETSKASPFDYENNSMIYVSESVPFPNNQSERYVMSVANEIEKLITAANGHAAALFTSYRVMGQAADELKKRGLPYPLFMMGKNGVHTLEKFKKSGNGVLFAAGGMWEGVDLPGDILSLLIIVKLPFAVPDPISEHEKAMCGSYEKYRNSILFPEMIIKLKQGHGRVLRLVSDTGVIALLDSRVRTGAPYRSKVLNALPKCFVTSSVVKARNFLLSKKSPDYFKKGHEV
jgi:ATP-dependent DNA helicase DinG